MAAQLFKEGRVRFPQSRRLLYGEAGALIDAGRAAESLTLLKAEILTTPGNGVLWELRSRAESVLGMRLAQHRSLGELYAIQGNYAAAVQNRTENDPPLENGGEGRAYGAELLLRQRFGNWYWGWIAYTLSFAERKDPMSGGYRPFDFDQTHILTVVASFSLPWDLELGGRFRYVTGSPDTPVVSAVYDGDSGIYVPKYGEPNSARNDDFHQLDIRLDKTWVFQDWILTTYIEVQNVYNRANPEGYSYNYNYTEREVISGLPIIPGFGIKGEF